MRRASRHHQKLTNIACRAFGKPEVIVRTCHKTNRSAERTAGERKHVDSNSCTYTRHLSDFAIEVIGKPEIAVRTNCDPYGFASFVRIDRKLVYCTGVND